MSTTSPVPGQYAALVDDAAIFPPGNAPLTEAVREHRGHRAAPYAGLLGPFVVVDVRLPELLEILTGEPDADAAPGPLPITVVVTGGAGGVEPAVRWGEGSPLVELCAVEVALRDLDDLVGNARRVVAAADTGVDVPVYVELPLQGGPGPRAVSWLAAADVVADADLRLKFRTGGTAGDAFPDSVTLAAALEASLDRELPFKCTAGLHAAVRHRAPVTGFEHHGFLNVLLATRAALDGEDAVAALEEPGPAAVVAGLDRVGPEGLERARRWFRSFGCCGVLDPWEDLVALGLAGTPEADSNHDSDRRSDVT